MYFFVLQGNQTKKEEKILNPSYFTQISKLGLDNMIGTFLEVARNN